MESIKTQRISYANSLENIENAVIQIKSVLNGEKI